MRTSTLGSLQRRRSTSRTLVITGLALTLASTAACSSRGSARPAEIHRETAGGSGDESVFGGVEFRELADGVWLHTSYKTLPEWGPVPSTGLIVRVDGGLVLVDTGWNDQQTEWIVEWAERRLRAPILLLVVTHAHDDKMGGVAVLENKGIRTYALDATNKAAVARHLTPTSETLALDGDIGRLAGAVEVFYPGAGHTEDNVVVYVEHARVLYGGCLIRPGASRSLGNTADADITHWDAAVESVKARYGTAAHVVPSHGPPGGVELLDHTIALVREHRANARPD